LISGPERKLELSLIDKVELGRAYTDVADEYCFNDDTLELYAEYLVPELKQKQKQKQKQSESQLSDCIE